MSITLKTSLDFKAKAAANRAKIKAALPNLLGDEILQIELRTQQGKDYKNQAFVGYSDDYAEYKRKNYGSDKVNLTLTGNMLSAMTYEVTEHENGVTGRIFFSNTSSISPGGSKAVTAPYKAVRNNARREFFGLSEEQQTRVREKIREAIKAK